MAFQNKHASNIIEWLLLTQLRHAPAAAERCGCARLVRKGGGARPCRSDGLEWRFRAILARGPEDASAVKAYYQKAAALGNEEAKARLKRMECPTC
jgi:hypothetical protein